MATYKQHRNAAITSGLIMVISLAGLAACSKTTNDKVEDAATGVMQDASSGISEIASDIDTNKTEDFVKKTAISNMFEIETSTIALTKATTADIKGFAQQMISDHKKAGKAFDSAVANTTSLVPPTQLDDDHKTKLDDLNSKTGADFDKAYVSLQKDAHADAVNLFDDYAKTGKDASLKSFAATTLPTLEMHKDRIDKMNP